MFGRMSYEAKVMIRMAMPRPRNGADAGSRYAHMRTLPASGQSPTFRARAGESDSVAEDI